jgi:ribosomal protein S13
MISNTELKKNLKKDGLNLDDNQLNSIRTFLVQMATIEYSLYREQKSNVKNCQTNKIIELSQESVELNLNIA